MRESYEASAIRDHFFGGAEPYNRGYELPHDSWETYFDAAYFQGLSENSRSPEALTPVLRKFFGRGKVHLDQLPGLRAHLRARLYHGGFPAEWWR